MTEIIVPNRRDLLKSNLTLDIPARSVRSTWSRKRTVVGLPGVEMWRGEIAIFPQSTESGKRPWRAFLAALRGSENWFRWNLPCARHYGDKPTVAAGAGDGYTLPLEGMAPNMRILRAGSYMTVELPSGHHRAVTLIADLRTNGAGQATAVFEPALDEAPAQGTVVETTDPFIPMARSDSLMGLGQDGGVLTSSFSVEEAF